MGKSYIIILNICYLSLHLIHKFIIILHCYSYREIIIHVWIY